MRGSKLHSHLKNAKYCIYLSARSGYQKPEQLDTAIIA